MTYPPEPGSGSDWSNPGGQWGSPDQGGYGANPPTPPPPPPPHMPPAPTPGAPQYGGAQYGGQQFGGPGQLPPQSYIPTQPGIIPLRPLTLGQIFDGALKALRANPMVMFVFAGLIIGITTIVELTLSASFFSGYMTVLDLLEEDPSLLDLSDLGSLFAGTLAPMIIGAIMSLVASTILTGVLTFAVSQAILGYKPTVGQVWAQVKGQVLRLIGLVLLIGLLTTIVPGLLFGLTFLVGSVAPGGILVLVLLLALLVAALWLALVAVGTALATPALMLERSGPITAISRSWQLTKPYFWRVLGILLLTWLITSVVSSVILMPFSIFAFALPLSAMLILQGVGAAIASTLITPFTAAVVALLYVDIRIRREGLAAELAAAAAQ